MEVVIEVSSEVAREEPREVSREVSHEIAPPIARQAVRRCTHGCHTTQCATHMCIEDAQRALGALASPDCSLCADESALSSQQRAHHAQGSL